MNIIQGRNIITALICAYGLLSATSSLYGKMSSDGAENSSRTASGPVTACGTESFRVRFVPVCPIEGDERHGLVFEDSQKPLFTIEAKRDEAMRDEMPGWASVGSLGFDPAKKDVIVGLRKMELTQDNVFAPSFEGQIQFEYSYLDTVFKRLPAKGGNEKLQLYLFVCHDADRDGRCSNEPLQNQLTLRMHRYEPCQIPEEIPIAVWAGCR